MQSFPKNASSLITKQLRIGRMLRYRRIGVLLASIIMLSFALILIFGQKLFLWNETVTALASAAGSAFLGVLISLAVAEIFSRDEWLKDLIATGTGALTSTTTDPQVLEKYRKHWYVLHTTRLEETTNRVSKGFIWMRSELDLRAPAPGRLVGTCTTIEPGTDIERQYLVEAFLRKGMLTIYSFPTDGAETIDATFAFPMISDPNHCWYGCVTHMTYASVTDLAQSAAVLVPADFHGKGRDVLLNDKSLGQLSPGLALTMDTLWYKHRPFKIFPRILPQISVNYVNLSSLTGKWLFGYRLIHGRSGEVNYSKMSMQQSGSRFIITPRLGFESSKLSCVESAGHWVAEVQGFHSHTLAGRWWALRNDYVAWLNDLGPDILPARSQVPAASMGDHIVGMWMDDPDLHSGKEGALTLSVVVNQRKLCGMFTGDGIAFGNDAESGSGASLVCAVPLTADEAKDRASLDELMRDAAATFGRAMVLGAPRKQTYAEEDRTSRSDGNAT